MKNKGNNIFTGVSEDQDNYIVIKATEKIITQVQGGK